MRWRWATIGLVILACGGERPEAAPPAEEWVTIEGVDFPAALARAPSEIVESYVFAAHHPEVLRYMPCYCQCENAPFHHVSNYDCFVDQIKRDGPRPRVEIDPMGFS